MFAFGIVLIFAGVVLLTTSAVKPSVRNPEPLPAAEEVCGWCKSGYWMPHDPAGSQCRGLISSMNVAHIGLCFWQDFGKG
jgi:hypothetical protein